MNCLCECEKTFEEIVCNHLEGIFTILLIALILGICLLFLKFVFNKWSEE